MPVMSQLTAATAMLKNLVLWIIRCSGAMSLNTTIVPHGLREQLKHAADIACDTHETTHRGMENGERPLIGALPRGELPDLLPVSQRLKRPVGADPFGCAAVP